MSTIIAKIVSWLKDILRCVTYLASLTIVANYAIANILWAFSTLKSLFCDKVLSCAVGALSIICTLNAVYGKIITKLTFSIRLWIIVGCAREAEGGVDAGHAMRITVIT